MANTKEYRIVINGITESVNAVKALEKELFNLEERIKALEAKSINVKTGSSGGGGSSRTSNVTTLNEEEQIQREINKLKAEGEKLDAKIAATQNEIYKRVDATKQLYKETVADQKALAAQERLTANAYSNTMQGMKNHLADLKAVINTTDLGDSDKIKQMTQEANELTNKLKEMEEAYGQFGRNVGNYKSAFEGLTVVIGNTTAHFDNAKQALKELKKERDTLSTKKDLGLISEEELKRLKELIPVVAQLKSSINDAGKPMDALMDSMQSFTAMAQIGKGFSAFFGFDNTEVEKSIQKLVALQNAMQGLQTIQKQMQSEEGIGKIFSKASGDIDKFVAGITNAKIGVEGLTKSSKLGTLAVRGLSMALKGIGIGLVIEAINLLVDGISWVTGKISDWVKGNADLVKEEKLLEAQLDFVNKKLEERNDELAASYYEGAITQEEYFRKSLEETTNVINEQIKALKERAALEGGSLGENLTQGNYKKEISMSWGGGTREVENLDELTKLWKEYTEAVDDGTDAMSKHAEETGSVTEWFKSLIYTLDDTKDDLTDIGQIAIGEFLKNYEHAMQTMAIDTKEGEKELEALKKSMDDNEMLRSIFMNLDQYVPVESFRKRIQQIINLIRGVKTEMGDMEQRTVQQVLRSEQLKIDAMKDGAAKRQAQRDLDKKKELADATLTAEDKANIQKKYQQRALREEQNANKKLKSEADKNKKQQLEIEKEIASARIAAMKEGLNKTITQLEEERKQRLAKLDRNMRNYKELEKEINDLYNERILKATDDWKEKMEKTHNELWANIVQKEKENLESAANQASNTLEKNIEKVKNIYTDLDNKTSAGYGIFGKLGKGAQSMLDSTGIQSVAQDNMTKEVKFYVERNREVVQLNQEYLLRLQQFENDKKKLSDDEAKAEEMGIEAMKKRLDKKKTDLEEYWNSIVTYFDDETLLKLVEKSLYREGYSDDISKIFNERITATKRYWQDIKAVTESGANAEYSARFAVIKKGEEQENASNDAWRKDTLKKEKEFYKDRISGVKTQYDKQLITQEEYKTKIEEAEKQHTSAMESIQTEWKTKSENIAKETEISIEKIEKEKNEKIRKNDIEEYESRLQEFRDFQSAINDVNQRQPVRNAWGFIDWKQTDKNNQELKNSYISLLVEINDVRAKAYEALSDETLPTEFKNQVESILRESNRLTVGVSEDLEVLSENMSDWVKTQTFFQDIQMYLQEVANSFNTIMSAVWEAQDTQMDKQAEALDKENQMIEDALDKQQEIIQKHKDKVNDIEDELQTARGARREHLIDQLNAEVAAQRRAAQEEKKLQKQKDALDKKQDDLDKERKRQQYHRDVLQAVVNGAMAVTRAAVNNWPIPAIPMMALAASTTAAQIAIMAANKPYAKGGVLDDGGVAVGPRHSQGGIPVLGGKASIEGGEFITNRVTTQKNVELLEYINSKKKRIDISDLVEFYGTPVRTNIKRMSPTTRFADGGIVPTLRTDIDINSRLIESFDRYANKPTIVQVVDIVDKTKQYNNVRVLAGLE